MAATVVAYGTSAPVRAASAGEPSVPSSAVLAAAEPSPPVAPTTEPAPPAAPPDDPAAAVPAVAVVGDSLAFSAAEQLDRTLRAAGVRPLLDVAPGRRIPVWGLDGQISPGLDAIAALRLEAPDAWVIELGTNDVDEEPFDRGRYAVLIAAVLDAIGRGERVIWVNVDRHDRPEESRAFNENLRFVAASRPGVSVIDWAALAEAEPALGPDGVHLSPWGMQRMADVIGAAVGERLAEAR
jgi:hypothetical protein